MPTWLCLSRDDYYNKKLKIESMRDYYCQTEERSYRNSKSGITANYTKFVNMKKWNIILKCVMIQIPKGTNRPRVV